MSEHVRFVVLINPNNPTGNVATPDEVDAMLRIVKAWPQCMIIADEIYDGLDFTGHHVSVASRSSTVPVVTLNGVSKVFFAPGWRIGWFGLHDPSGALGAVREALERLLRSRLCASTPAQHGYLAGLTGDRSWLGPYLERVQAQRQRCLDRIATIYGLEVEAPGGAFYMFIRLTDDAWANNDKQFVLDLLHEEHVLLVHGSGFSPTEAKAMCGWCTWPTLQSWTKLLTASNASSSGIETGPSWRWILEQVLTPHGHEPRSSNHAGRGLARPCGSGPSGHCSAE